MSLETKTILEHANDLRAKKYSSVELTQFYLDRAKTHDPKINSFITTCPESAISAATLADERLKQGEENLLCGIPLAQKDIFCTDGIKTSCGSKMLDNFIAPYDATVISNFKQAGAVMIGKTNMDEFAMGSSNENSFYGAVKNPWDLNCTPGGSSGGAAAAVAAQLAPGATGTDTGGSIRQPAAFCGITGMKPTYGCVSRFGMIAFASSLDQAGPMAKTAADNAILLQAMAGHDAKDSTSVKRTADNYSKDLNSSLEGLTIGLPVEYFPETLDSKMHAAIDDVVKVYEKLGAKVKKISLKHTSVAPSVYYILAPAEASANLSRYDGVRYGYRCKDPKDLTDLYTRSRSEGFGEEVKRRILIGTYVLSSGFYDAYYIRAQKVRRKIQSDFLEAFKEVDVILTPTTPTPAFELGQKNADPVTMYMNDIFTIAVNLAGLPALSMPAGLIDNKPVGAQLIGPHWSEAKLLNVAHQFQRQTDWHKQSPEL